MSVCPVLDQTSRPTPLCSAFGAVVWVGRVRPVVIYDLGLAQPPLGHVITAVFNFEFAFVFDKFVVTTRTWLTNAHWACAGVMGGTGQRIEA